jgi:hypothetical protein
MKIVLPVVVILALYTLYPCYAHDVAAAIRVEKGDCGKPKAGGERFRTKYYIDSNGDGKVDMVRVVFCDGNTTMTKPIVVGTNNFDANHYFLLEDYGNTNRGDVLVWFEGPVKNDSGITVGSVVKDSTSIQCTVTFFSQIRLSPDQLSERRVHPEQNYTSFEDGGLLFRPTKMGMNRIEISRWTGTKIDSHVFYVYVDRPLTEGDAYVLSTDGLSIKPDNYFLTVSNAGSVLLDGRVEIK